MREQKLQEVVQPPLQERRGSSAHCCSRVVWPPEGGLLPSPVGAIQRCRGEHVTLTLQFCCVEVYQDGP